MKKRFVLAMAVVLSLGLVLASCDGDNPIAKIYQLALTAKDGSSNTHVLPVTITSAARSARAVDIDEDSVYTINFGGVVISEGTVTVSGNKYTFTPTAGAVFTYDEGTKVATGSITVSAAAKAAIEATMAGDMGGVAPSTLTVESVMETQSGGGTYDGTWGRVWVDTENEYARSWGDYNQEIVFSGNTYTLKMDGETIETGTFLYCLPPVGLFIFSRNNMEPQIVTYFYEGSPEGVGDDPPQLGLYNWFWDAMEIATIHGGEEHMRFTSPGFIKKPYTFD